MRQTPMWRRYQRLWGSNPAADANDEVEFHIGMRIADLVRSGKSEADARRQAQTEFGDMSRIRAELEALGTERERQSGSAGFRDTLGQDIGYGARALMRNPAFSVIAIITLALGMGVSTAMFTVLNAVLLRPLPFHQPDSVVVVWNRFPFAGYERVSLAPLEYNELVAGTRSFASLSAVSYREVNLLGIGEPERLAALEVTPEFFGTLGVRAALGRTFDAQSARGELTAVLSHDLWRRRFAGDRAIIGRTITLDKRPVVVIGVMPPAFELPNPASFIFPERAELWLPLDLSNAAEISRGAKYLRAIGRLQPTVSASVAASDLDVLGKRFKAENKGHYPDGWSLNAVPIADQVLGSARGGVKLVSAVVGLVLLIACINVASLIIARMIGRRREIAIRTALGAGRGRILRQLLVENLLLTTIAGALGLLLASLITSLLRVHGPVNVPRLQTATIDASAAAVALVLCILAGVAFALIAALTKSAASVESVLRGAGRGIATGRRSARAALVISEIALACIVLISAGLLMNSLLRVMQIDPGIEASGVLIIDLSLPNSDYPDPDTRVALYGDVIERIRTIPGVRAAAVVNPLPLAGDLAEAGFSVEDHAPAPGEPALITPYASISPEYFQALGVRLLRGRAFSDADRRDGASVVIVDQTFADRFWPGTDPVGKRIHVGGTPDSVWTTVVGVTAPVAAINLEAQRRPHMYLPMTQRTRSGAALVVRGVGDASQLIAPVRAALRSRDPNLPMSNVRSMDDVLSASVSTRRYSAVLLVAFAAAALLLAAVGLYGLISYTVSQRTREIGIRMALGGRSRDVARMVLKEGLALSGTGLVIGLLAALAAGQLIARYLYGVGATDARTFAMVAFLLIGVSVFAAWIPARRAARVPPLVALRGE
ncbi:MAG: ABC transporter permease [Gemmatimonadota bacterium]